LAAPTCCAAPWARRSPRKWPRNAQIHRRLQGHPQHRRQEIGRGLRPAGKFANYGFNKSHAAAYAVVSYQTAWLKANYPVEFMAAVMNCDIHLTDKLAVYKREVDKLGIDRCPLRQRLARHLHRPRRRAWSMRSAR
jgi:hypothetical protein